MSEGIDVPTLEGLMKAKVRAHTMLEQARRNVTAAREMEREANERHDAADRKLSDYLTDALESYAAEPPKDTQA